MSEILDRIAEIAGDDAARRFADEYGGRRIYLPRHLPADHALCNLLGFDAAVQIRNEIGTGHLDVPKGAPPAENATTRRVRELTAAGHSAGEIARQLKITARTVHRHRAKARH